MCVRVRVCACLIARVRVPVSALRLGATQIVKKDSFPTVSSVKNQVFPGNHKGRMSLEYYIYIYIFTAHRTSFNSKRRRTHWPRWDHPGPCRCRASQSLHDARSNHENARGALWHGDLPRTSILLKAKAVFAGPLYKIRFWGRDWLHMLEAVGALYKQRCGAQ